MGYVHDTSFTAFIPPQEIGVSAGTWTLTVASNIWSNNKSAADESFTIFIPVKIPGNGQAAYSKGCRFKSLEIMYEVGTAGCDDVATVKLYKNTFTAAAQPTGGSINTVAEVTAVTLDAYHDSAVERKAVDHHRMTITPTTPPWVDDGEYYHVEIVVDAAATSVFKIFGAIVNYDLRV